MNGIGLLVLIAAAAQIGSAPQFPGQMSGQLSNQLPAQVPAQLAAQQIPQSQPTPLGPSAEWGWDIDDDNALYYIIQISEVKFKEMQVTGYEFPSDMPPELVGRATRIAVRFGTNLLPQNPSLEELRKIPRVNSPSEVTAQLEPGRFSDVESDKLQQVQQDRSAPAMPSFGNPGAGATTPQLDTQPNLIDQLKADTNAFAERAKSLVPGTPNLPSFPGATGATNKFNTPAAGSPLEDRTGIANNSNNWQNTNPLPSVQSDYQQQLAREEAARLANSRLTTPPTTGNFVDRNTPTNSSAYGSGAYASGAYDTRDPSSLTAEMFQRMPQRQTPGGFGGSPGAVNQGAYAPNNGQFSSNNYPNQYAPRNESFATAPPAFSNDLINDPTTHLAANPVGNGAPSVIIPVSAPPSTNSPASASPNGSEEENQPLAAKSKSTDSILAILFLLSLIVNVYLGMILRKLLMRYRAAVANNRGIVVPNAYS